MYSHVENISVFPTTHVFFVHVPPFRVEIRFSNNTCVLRVGSCTTIQRAEIRFSNNTCVFTYLSCETFGHHYYYHHPPFWKVYRPENTCLVTVMTFCTSPSNKISSWKIFIFLTLRPTSPILLRSRFPYNAICFHRAWRPRTSNGPTAAKTASSSLGKREMHSETPMHDALTRIKKKKSNFHPQNENI